MYHSLILTVSRLYHNDYLEKDGERCVFGLLKASRKLSANYQKERRVKTSAVYFSPFVVALIGQEMHYDALTYFAMCFSNQPHTMPAKVLGAGPQYGSNVNGTVPCSGNDVVISGVSGRLPESNSIAEFRENLFTGVDMVTDDDRRWPAGK